MSAVQIEMLPAQHGDCLLVQYGTDPDRARVLIDGGPANAYAGIRDRLCSSLGGDRSIDVLVVTHVDTDHIEGVLELLADTTLGIDVGDVWFNGYDHLVADRVRPERGGVQGEYLASLLHQARWNTATGGASIRAWDDGEPMVLRGPDGERETFTIISPTAAAARRMAAKWKQACDDASLPARRHPARARPPGARPPVQRRQGRSGTSGVVRDRPHRTERIEHRDVVRDRRHKGPPHR